MEVSEKSVRSWCRAGLVRWRRLSAAEAWLRYRVRQRMVEVELDEDGLLADAAPITGAGGAQAQEEAAAG